MARKSPKSKKSTPATDTDREWEYIETLKRAAEGTSVAEPKRASFIPDGYSPISEVANSFDGGWERLRQGLYQGTIQGFLLAETGDFIKIPAEDWGGTENDNVAETDVVTIYSRAISGMRKNTEGFAVILKSSLEAIEPSAVDGASTAAGGQATVHRPSQTRMRGRRARAKDAAKRSLADLYPEGIPNISWKTIAGEVNAWLRERNEKPVSEDTVRRAAKLL